jgi:hypothetical protein
MFNNIPLDIFIGLTFVFLLYSLLATILQEIISQLFGLRSRMLLKAIRRMLEDQKKETGITLINGGIEIILNLIRFFSPFFDSDKKLIKTFYEYPSIKYLGESSWHSKPAYMDASNFSQTLIYMLRGQTYDGTNQQMILIKTALFVSQKAEDYSGTKITIGKETLSHLQKIYFDSNGDIDRFRALLEKWYNDTMQRASGWYKRQTQLILFLSGWLLAFSFNVDTISIYNILAKDKTARDNLVQLAISASPKYDSIVSKTELHTGFKKDTVVRTIDKTNYISRNDTVLNGTKKIILEDMDKAGSIVAFGWPDKDSCKVCDSLKSILVATKASDSPNIKHLNALIQYYNKYYKCNGIPYQTTSTRWIGWLLTALAISLGAPFWFDLLSKFIQLRGTGTKPPPPDPDPTLGNTGGGNTPGPSPINRVG